jgi:ParB family transcriptional regulator, chromosome partitioning protein
MAKKRLGIDALFASTVVPAAAEAAGVRQLPLDELSPNPNQPRRTFDERALSNLVGSIKQSGVLQPIIARERTGSQRGSHPGRARYEIVAGERRWRAARLAGLAEIPAIVRPLSDEEALKVTLIENLQREDLNPVEETEGYLALLKFRLSEEPEFATFARVSDKDPYGDVLRLLFAMNNQRAGERAGEKRGRTTVNNNVVTKLAPLVESSFAAIGRTNWLSFIQHRLPLRRLPADLLEALRAGKIEYTKARLLGRLTGDALGTDEHQAVRLRQRLVEQAVSESLSLGVLRGMVEAELAEARGEKKTARASGHEIPLEDLAHQTASRLNRLRSDQIPEKYRQQIQRKLDELSRLIERASK